MPLFNALIVRYGEISLKGKNRGWFEKLLQTNIVSFLRESRTVFERVQIQRGRIYILGITSPVELERVFGIHSYSPAMRIGRRDELLAEALEVFLPDIGGAKSFRVSCQRIDKSYHKTSPEMEREIGAFFFERTKTPVNLCNPDLEFRIEISSDAFLLFSRSIPGWGGMPYTSAGRLIALISDGIDSPVAVFLMMKRGAEPILLHFFHTEEQLRKMDQIKRKLEQFTSGKKLQMHAIPHGELFKGRFQELKRSPDAPYLCVACKYLMHRRALELARSEKAHGIITGDNLAQVASQTLQNLKAQRTAAELPVYSPLIAFDKQETIDLAKKIGLFELSIAKAQGCVPPLEVKTAVSSALLGKIISRHGLDAAD